MFVVMNRFSVKPEFADKFEARIRNRPGMVEKQPGFVRVQLLRPANVDAPYIVLTLWETQTQYEAWVNHPDFTRKHAGPRQLSKEIFRGPNKVETFTVTLDSANQ